MCGRGAWAFEAYPRGSANPVPHVIKDSRGLLGGDRAQNCQEGLRTAIGHDEFCE